MMTGGGRTGLMFDRLATVAIVTALTLLQARAATARAAIPDLRTYKTRYYVIHTDLGREAAREAEVRLTRMAEEYRRRTRDFSGEIRRKLPFYLFKNEADYHAAGGEPNTAGEYDPNAQALKAFAGGDQPNLATWYTVQHEGFHQFADHVIGRKLPIWVNEGLAEYFGEALFTGDGFVAGLVPPWRLKRVRETLDAGKFTPLLDTVRMKHPEWNRGISTTNYDHVWSLVHFLIHGEDGARREQFAAFLKDAVTAKDPQDAFSRHFDVKEIEAKWHAYWMNLGDDPTADLYAEATLRTLTSFLARATARRQRFETFDAFRDAAAGGELKLSESDWLPPSLLKEALTRAADVEKRGGRFTLVADPPRSPTIVLVGNDVGKMVGRFTLKGARIDRITIDSP